MNDIKTLQLKHTAIKRRASGHLWVFSNELEKVDTTIPPGTICSLLFPSGQPAGVGFFNPKSLIALRLLAQNTLKAPEHFVKDRLAAALRELPEDRQRIVWMKFFLDLPNTEIAANTGLTPSHVGVLVHRCVKALRLLMEPPPPTDSDLPGPDPMVQP